MAFNEINGDFILADSIVPIGTSIESACSSAPTNYLEEDGSALSRTTYVKLFTAIGTTYGVGDGSSTFNIPDRRGAYPRGRGVSSLFSQNRTSVMGEQLSDNTQGHYHTVDGAVHYGGADNYGHVGAGNGYGFNYQSSTAAYGMFSSGYGTPRIGSETRPNSIILNYFIRY